MRSARSIFIKQAKDSLKNKAVLIQFILFPIMAFILTELVAKPTEDISNSIYVTMFAAMFAGMTPLTMTAGAIAEDREHKSLRFLVMAGVKPHEYLLGIGGYILVICTLVSFVFGLIGGFTGTVFVEFVVILIIGSAASMLLGATIGIFSKNQQSATAISTPVFLILAFSPMISMFNETVANITSIFYTQQINMVVNDFSTDIVKPLLIIGANIVVLLVLFILAYTKKGLKG